MSTRDTKLVSEKSEILFIYDSVYGIPNGDPFTGEQRYDDESKRVLVSDVRIKRFIRDYFQDDESNCVYVANNRKTLGREKITSSERFLQLKTASAKIDQERVVLECIDVRLFGAVVAIKQEKKRKNKDEKPDDEGVSDGEEASAFNLTGPVQFAMLNPSLNEVDLRMHQNTSHFVSKSGNKQGAIATTTLVPYSVNHIHGWVNPRSAGYTRLTEADVQKMFEALWISVNDANTRTKSNQNSLLLLQLVYSDPKNKLYRVDELIKIEPIAGKSGRELRGLADFKFDFSNLAEAAKSSVIGEVRYWCGVDGCGLSQIKSDLIDAFADVLTEEGKSKLIELPFPKYNK